MKKIAEKIALVALVCITFVFVLLTVLYATGVIPPSNGADSAVAIVLLSLLAAMYLGVSAYLLVVNFSEIFYVKRILLFYDAEGTTRASHKVVKNIIKGCAKEFPQLKIRRCVFHVDDKMGIVANISLESLVAEDIAVYVPRLKCLIIKSFNEALGLKFNAINFDIIKLIKKYSPADTDVESAMQSAASTTTVEPEPTADDDDEKNDPVYDDIMRDRNYDDYRSDYTTDYRSDHKQDDIADGEDKDLIDF